MLQDVLDGFKRQIGQEFAYEKGGKLVCKGILKDVKVSDAKIADVNNVKDKRYGVHLKLKPTDGYNKGRAIWTIAFDSGVPIQEEALAKK